MYTLNLPAKHGYSVQFSPYMPDRLACACCQNYGILGSANVFIIDLIGQNLVVKKSFSWNNAIFDICWSECNENLIAAAGGDGSLLLYDVTQQTDYPTRIFRGHEKEIYSVSWNQTRQHQLVLTASWDYTVKMWDMVGASDVCLNNFQHSQAVLYDAQWSPVNAYNFLSVTGAGTSFVWDIRTHTDPAIALAKYETEILSCDWCKYDANIAVTASTDGVIRVWDIRSPGKCICELVGHEMAIRRVKFSPYVGNKIISASYDYTVRSWNYLQQPSPLETLKHHTEFVYGLNCNIHRPGLVGDCSWDRTVKVYQCNSIIQN